MAYWAVCMLCMKVPEMLVSSQRTRKFRPHYTYLTLRTPWTGPSAAPWRASTPSDRAGARARPPRSPSGTPWLPRRAARRRSGSSRSPHEAHRRSMEIRSAIPRVEKTTRFGDLSKWIYCEHLLSTLAALTARAGALKLSCPACRSLRSTHPKTPHHHHHHHHTMAAETGKRIYFFSSEESDGDQSLKNLRIERSSGRDRLHLHLPFTQQLVVASFPGRITVSAPRPPRRAVSLHPMPVAHGRTGPRPVALAGSLPSPGALRSSAAPAVHRGS